MPGRTPQHAPASPAAAGRMTCRAAPPLRSTALAQSLSTGLPAVSDSPARRRPDRSARLEQLGRRRHADGERQAAAGQRPASRHHIPSLWYLAHMSAGDFDVIGATLPGAPAVAIGRNRFIAWGETNVAADVEDFFLERVDPTGTSVEFHGAQEPLRIVPETIVVKGGRSGPCSTCGSPVTVRSSRTRSTPTTPRRTITPKPAPLEPLAFRWTALDDEDRTVVAFLKLNEARNWDEFTSALRDFVAPSQNFVYADVDGHIGYYAPGTFRCGQRATARGRRKDGPATPNGPAGFRSKSCRTPSIRPSTSSSRRTIGRPMAGVSASDRRSNTRNRTARSASSTCFEQKGSRLTPDDFRAFRRTRCRCTRRRWCRCC